MLEKDLYKKLKKVLEPPFSVCILTHVNPDGDAIGSMLGLYWYLKLKGCRVNMATPNEIPFFLEWMPGGTDIRNFETDPDVVIGDLEDADMIFCLDFNNSDRLAGLERIVTSLHVPKILIDHHPNPDGFADYIISDTAVSSSAELIYKLIVNLGDRELINRNIAMSIYTGILTDTGCFSFNCSDPETFRIVADLLGEGIDKDGIYSRIFDNYSVDRMRMLGYSLSEKMVILPALHTAYISLSKKELEDFNHVSGDTEGFVNFPFSIKDIRITAFFLEKDDYVKISFRSKGNFHINLFAEKYFNGGGHKNAAGGESKDSLEGTLKRFEELISRHAEDIQNL